MWNKQVGGASVSSTVARHITGGTGMHIALPCVSCWDWVGLHIQKPELPSSTPMTNSSNICLVWAAHPKKDSIILTLLWVQSRNYGKSAGRLIAECTHISCRFACFWQKPSGWLDISRATEYKLPLKELQLAEWPVLRPENPRSLANRSDTNDSKMTFLISCWFWWFWGYNYFIFRSYHQPHTLRQWNVARWNSYFEKEHHLHVSNPDSNRSTCVCSDMFEVKTNSRLDLYMAHF